jgi:hypothetical protein
MIVDWHLLLAVGGEEAPSLFGSPWPLVSFVENHWVEYGLTRCLRS